MYTRYFGFSRRPFNPVAEKGFLYFSSSVREVYERFLAAIERRECSLLTGEVGSGKTILFHRLMNVLRENKQVSLYHYNVFSFEDLLVFLCKELGIESVENDRDLMLEKISLRFAELAKEGRSVVFFIDEAQSLEENILLELELLCRSKGENRRLISILFSGQDPFEKTLKKYPFLDRSVSERCRLEAFNFEEVEAYIGYCMGSAGFDGANIFTADAVRSIAKISKGIPGKIDSICDLALQSAFQKSIKTVTEEIISEVSGYVVGTEIDSEVLTSMDASLEKPSDHSGSQPAKIPVGGKRKNSRVWKFFPIGGAVALSISAFLLVQVFFQHQADQKSPGDVIRLRVNELPAVAQTLSEKKKLEIEADSMGTNLAQKEAPTDLFTKSLPLISGTSAAVFSSKRSVSSVGKKSVQVESLSNASKTLLGKSSRRKVPKPSVAKGPALIVPTEKLSRSEKTGVLRPLKQEMSFPQLWIRPKVSTASALKELNSDQKALFEAVREGGQERVKNILGGGVRVNVRDALGETALMYAARAGEVYIAKKLIEAGAFLNLKSQDGQTALSLAIFHGQTVVVRALLRGGAHPDIRDNGGRTALMGAAWSGDAESSKLLLIYGSDPNLKNAEGWTPLMYAAFNNHVPVVEALLGKGADVTLRNQQGNDAFDLARARKSDGTIQVFDEVYCLSEHP